MCYTYYKTGDNIDDSDDDEGGDVVDSVDDDDVTTIVRHIINIVVINYN